MCGTEITDDARFCAQCGTLLVDDSDDEDILDIAIAEAEAEFEEELEESGILDEDETECDEDGEMDEGEEAGGDEDEAESRKSAMQRIREVSGAIKDGTGKVVKFGKKVGDGTAQAIRTTKDVSRDVGEKVGHAVKVSKHVSGEVAKGAKVVGKKVKVGVEYTGRKVHELGQVRKIITDRSLDVVRASLKAVERVDKYLEQTDSNYEVGNFITGVSIPPYLEIEFHKRAENITEKEREVINAFRCSDFSDDVMDYVFELLEKGKEST